MPGETCPNCATPVSPAAAYCPGCGRPTSDDPALTPMAPHPDDDPRFRVRLQRALGDDFGLEQMIGQGGFGRVYVARDRRLGRTVAIKAIRPDLAGATAFLDRFRREGVALAKLRHPGIVPIYDIRESEGLIYYIMPFIQGENLRTKLERGRLAPKAVHRILLELCDSIAASHRAGIVHRDIKPDNVILEGVLGKVLLMDFGIAKELDSVDITGSGGFIGTPTYMSPEQAGGDGMPDHRSDLYSLGVLGYHMLTGEPPFTARTAHEMIAKHVTEAPVPVRRVHPSVPRPLADAVMRCLEKDPNDRPQSAMELWSDLERVTFFPTAPAPDTPARSPFSVHTVVFVWFAVLSLVFAILGDDPLAGLTRESYIYLTALFTALAALVSPAAREVGDLDQPVDEWVRGLLRGRAGEGVEDGGDGGDDGDGGEENEAARLPAGG